MKNFLVYKIKRDNNSLFSITFINNVMKELGCLKNNYNFYVVKLHFENPQCAIAHLRFSCLFA